MQPHSNEQNPTLESPFNCSFQGTKTFNYHNQGNPKQYSLWTTCINKRNLFCLHRIQLKVQ
ncbi:unnamed protein product [Coffea canephora]|uniref:Uncharacterized protein n=1 Tax=Coffea canephora TaxID=49390 RepID=A0A068VBE4_COFCA|nr:unnamed protein product [Coffea canephora]